MLYGTASKVEWREASELQPTQRSSVVGDVAINQ